MTRAKLRPYLRLVPLFGHLSRDELEAVADKLFNRRLAGGETLDLRGSRANVLCIVIKGRVKFEACLRGGQVTRSNLTVGQWAGEALIIGQDQAMRTRLTAYSREADVLLLWQRDLETTPIFKRLVVSVRLLSVSLALKNILRVLRRTGAGASRVIGSKAIEYPIAAGTFTALAFLATFLLFTQPGRALRADWKYLGTMQQGSLSESRQSRQLSRVLRLSPDHPSGQVAVGNLAAQSGDFDAAMLHYAEVANEDGAGSNNLGVVLLRQAVPATAMQALLLSTQMEPDIAVTHQNLGIAYQQLGQQREAVRAFKGALRIDPALIVARYHLGMHYLGQGNLVEAGTAFERVGTGCILCPGTHWVRTCVH